MRIVFLILPLFLFSFTWDDYDSFVEAKRSQIQCLFEKALEEANRPPASLALYGSLCFGNPFIDSDLEFTILIPDGCPPPLFFPFLDRFRHHCRAASFFWKEPNLIPFLISLSEFTRYRLYRGNGYLRYGLSLPAFGGGDLFLFQRFCDLFLRGPIFPYYIEGIASCLENGEKCCGRLKKLLSKRCSKKEHLFPLHRYCIAPALDLIRWLCIRNLIYPKNLRGALSLLLLASVITERQYECLNRYFLFCFGLCSRFGAEFSTRNLSNREIGEFTTFFPCLWEISPFKK